ncbi:MAG: hypothetical protein KF791_20280, partial [Verrucomicrobiae bacterium]|nr:hypothetical protein [Verrucomicrobiae bacterium]
SVSTGGGSGPSCWRGHIRCSFWKLWHDWRGRKRHLRSFGVHGAALKRARTSAGAWRVAKPPAVQRALNNALLRRWKFLMPSDLGASVQHGPCVQPPDA